MPIHPRASSTFRFIFKSCISVKLISDLVVHPYACSRDRSLYIRAKKSDRGTEQSSAYRTSGQEEPAPSPNSFFFFQKKGIAVRRMEREVTAGHIVCTKSGLEPDNKYAKRRSFDAVNKNGGLACCTRICGRRERERESPRFEIKGRQGPGRVVQQGMEECEEGEREGEEWRNLFSASRARRENARCNLLI